MFPVMCAYVLVCPERECEVSASEVARCLPSVADMIDDAITAESADGRGVCAAHVCWTFMNAFLATAAMS